MGDGPGYEQFVMLVLLIIALHVVVNSIIVYAGRRYMHLI